MAQPTPRFLALPQELLLQISRFLPADGILSLKLTHPVLNNVFPLLPSLDPHLLTPCTRLAVERLCVISTSPLVARRCFVCRRRYPANMFTSSKSPVCASPPPRMGTSRPEIVDLPPFFCAWHVGRLVRLVHTGPGGRNGWTSQLDRMCRHLGCILGWEDCDCNCASCGSTTVRTYTRYLNNSHECRRFTFWRDVDARASEESEDQQARSRGRLYVREECQQGGTGQPNFVINLPVQFEERADVKVSHPRSQRIILSSFKRHSSSMAGHSPVMCLSKIQSLCRFKTRRL